MQENYLTVQEAADRLRVNVQTVRKWIREGKLKGSLMGGRRSGYRIPDAEIRRVLTEGVDS